MTTSGDVTSEFRFRASGEHVIQTGAFYGDEEHFLSLKAVGLSNATLGRQRFCCRRERGAHDGGYEAALWLMNKGNVRLTGTLTVLSAEEVDTPVRSVVPRVWSACRSGSRWARVSRRGRPPP